MALFTYALCTIRNVITYKDKGETFQNTKIENWRKNKKAN